MVPTPDAPSGTGEYAYQFPDGTEIELTVRTEEATLSRIFTADVAKRMRRVRQVTIENDASLVAFRSYVPSEGRGAHQSTTTHALPDGDVTVSIDATGRGMHGYLYHLVTAAVAYTHSVNLDPGTVAPICVTLLGLGIVLVSAGLGLLSLPLFGAGGTFAFHLLVYALSAHGVTVSLSRVPDPLGAS